METTLLKHPSLKISVKQFGAGAINAGKESGITVIIDNFRASNTILALLEAGAIVTPVQTIDEALKFHDYIKVGEKGGKKFELFDFDNSPYTISLNSQMLENKDVVIRTTNGTRGIINAIGSQFILIGSFRNLNAVVEFCKLQVSSGLSISFVAMGSIDIPRIEDVFGAKMMFYKINENLTQNNEWNNEFYFHDNPWNQDWVNEIIKKRGLNDNNKLDRLYCLELNKSNIVPNYDTLTGKFEIIKPMI